MITRGAFDDNSPTLIRLLAMAIRSINLLAKAFRHDRGASQVCYSIKDTLIEFALARNTTEIRLSWHWVNGSPAVKVALGGYYSAHAYFDGLSPASQCRIVNEIGPEPGDV